MPAEDITLYAQWTSLPTYTVSFNSQGGSSVPLQNVIEGGKAAVPAEPSRTGYAFQGWYKESACTNVWNFSVETVTSNLTLYAKWAVTYTVTYISNGATGGSIPVDTTKYVSGSTVTVLGPGSLVKTDYNFGGWNRKSDGTGTNYSPGETFQIGLADITLYDKWTLKPYTVTYNANSATNGTVPVDTHHYSEGDTVTVQGNTGNLQKSGFFFNGWNTNADGSGTDYKNTFSMLANDVVLYAQWMDFSGISYRDMVSITGGTYTQTDGTHSFEHTISSFKMAKYEVTYELWYTVHNWALSNGYTFANPGKEGNDGTVTNPAGADPTEAKYEPVTTINWRDAIVWCNAYSEMSGYSPVYYTDSGYTMPLKTATNNFSVDTTAGSEDNPYVNWAANGYRLPTEGEWQYAASNKGGTPYNYASGAAADLYNVVETQKVAWYNENSGNHTHTVGTTIDPSVLTLWDMSGNVSEWCWDWYNGYPGDSTDYRGAASGSYRVKRGGSWSSNVSFCSVAFRYYGYPHYRNSSIGFRVVRP